MIRIRIWWRSRESSRLAALLALLQVTCLPAGGPLREASALEVRYRQLRDRPRSRPATATRAYRSVVARALGSRCRMVYSDSETFDLRVSRCDGPRALILSVARLYLEAGASPALLPTLVIDGRGRWLDLPTGSCALF